MDLPKNYWNYWWETLWCLSATSWQFLVSDPCFFPLVVWAACRDHPFWSRRSAHQASLPRLSLQFHWHCLCRSASASTADIATLGSKAVVRLIPKNGKRVATSTYNVLSRETWDFVLLVDLVQLEAIIIRKLSAAWFSQIIQVFRRQPHITIIQFFAGCAHPKSCKRESMGFFSPSWPGFKNNQQLSFGTRKASKQTGMEACFDSL